MTIELADIPTAFRLQTAVPQNNSKQLQSSILALTERYRHLLPLELNEQKQLKEQLDALKRQLADAVADRLSLDFLKIRRRQESFLIGKQSFDCSVPKFAIFTLYSPTCSFTVNIDSSQYYVGRNDNPDDRIGLVVSTPGTLVDLFGLWDGMPEPTYDRAWIRNPTLPTRQSSHWWEYKLSKVDQLRRNEDIVKDASCLFSMLSYARSNNWTTSRTFTVSTTFTGALPDTIRKQIHIWQQLYDEVLICREAADWTVDEIQYPENASPDPLVFGRLDSDYWLLSKFDTTTAEEWVSTEWTTHHQ